MKKQDLLKVAKREKTFSTLAHKEAKGAIARLERETRAGMKESAKDTRWEVRVDKKFAKIRNDKAKSALRKVKEAK